MDKYEITADPASARDHVVGLDRLALDLPTKRPRDVKGPGVGTIGRSRASKDGCMDASTIIDLTSNLASARERRV